MPIALTASSSVPPRYVEKRSAVPVGFSLAINPSLAPPAVGWSADCIGKFDDIVPPPTYALPDASTAMPLAMSLPLPPRNVAYSAAVPAALSFSTNAFEPAALPLAA